METLLCERDQCDLSANKFCISCKTILCRNHVIEDVKKQRKSQTAEHYYIDALQYWFNHEKFACFYCKEHPDGFLTRRCINCFQYACNSCPVAWCSKVPGRYHDYDMLSDFVDGYTERMVEFQKQLHQKYEIIITQLKDASQKREEMKLRLERMLNDVDTAVESQIEAITEEGKKLKAEIGHEMSQICCHYTEKIKVIEEKQAMTKQLLQGIHEAIYTAGGAMAVHSYKQIKEKVTELMTWRMNPFVTTSFNLTKCIEKKSLGLKLVKTEAFADSLADVILCPEEKKSEIILKCNYSSDDQYYWGLSFLSANRIIVRGFNNLAHRFFTEIREGVKTYALLPVDPPIRQLLPYGNRILVLTGSRLDYEVRFMDSGNILYKFKVESWYDSPKLMAVTSSHQLMVLHEETQTLHSICLESKVEKDVLLSVNWRVYGVAATSDEKLLLLCKKEEQHAIMKYDPAQQQVMWASDNILTETWRSDRLYVAEYRESLYALSREDPTKVHRLSLSDGCITHQIPCDSLPSTVKDISLRGNTLAVTGEYEGISFFTITDVTNIL